MNDFDNEPSMSFAIRVMMMFVLALDCAAIAVLALIPLAGPLGLGDYEVPASAIAGWFYMAIPLVLAAAGLIGILMRIDALQNEILMKSAFCACTLAGILVIGVICGQLSVLSAPLWFFE